MTNIIVCGLASNKLVTQGYGSSLPTITAGDKWIGTAVTRKKLMPYQLLLIKAFLKAEAE